ncbi:MAG TPA: hypothetical protein ENI23_15335 [bacterium]|nr:hypothetical protein [bacterium]
MGKHKEIEDLFESIRRRCVIGLKLLQEGDEHLDTLIPTVAEDLIEDAQTLVLDYCTKEDQDG